MKKEAGLLLKPFAVATCNSAAVCVCRARFKTSTEFALRGCAKNRVAASAVEFEFCESVDPFLTAEVYG